MVGSYGTASVSPPRDQRDYRDVGQPSLRAPITRFCAPGLDNYGVADPIQTRRLRVRIHQVAPHLLIEVQPSK